MSKFDLNNAADFARVTLSDTAAILQQFYPGENPDQWSILEGSYNGVLFHVFQSNSEYQAALSSVQDSGGRRKVRYSFPYKDGQTTDDLGRKPETYTMDVCIHGVRYLQGVAALLREFNKPTPGILVHPVMGRIQVAVDSWDITHSPEARNAAVIRITFIEHNFTIGTVSELKQKTLKSALAQALDGFQKIEAAIIAVQANVKFAQSLKNSISTALTNFNAGYAVILSQINVSFNKAGSADIPTLLPVNEGGLQNQNGSLASNTFPVAGPLASVPASELSSSTTAAVAASELTKSAVALRDELSATIRLMLSQGEDSLPMHDSIVGLRETLILMQTALEAGVASSQAQIVQYVLPRVMSLREVAFENGLPVNRYGDIAILNPALESVNEIPAGTSLQVPIS